MNPELGIKNYHEKKNLKYPPLVFATPMDHFIVSTACDMISVIMERNKMQRKHEFERRTTLNEDYEIAHPTIGPLRRSFYP